ncbi:MAG: NAD(P)H-hydrate dehydratase [Bacteroidota bacterium]
MQLLASAEVMQGIDRSAIHKLRIPGLLLMENAGRAFVDELARRVGPLAGRMVAVVCGKGNNGGDGFVIARHLANRGCDVRVTLLGKTSSVTGDARTNLDALLGMVKRKAGAVVVEGTLSTRRLARSRNAVIIVDAILGTGFTGEVRGLYRDAIEWINRQQSFVAAVDVPSGVDASTGIVEGAAVRAHLTVTMGLAKIGHYVGAGADCSGDVRVVDISVPPALLKPGNGPVFRVEGNDAAAALPGRPRTAHKYSVGKVLVIGGSRNFSGAPLMTAQAVLRSGAGAVVLGFPAGIHAAVARRVTEVILAPHGDGSTASLGMDAAPALLERAAWADTVAIGPGLSREEKTAALVRHLVALVERPLVIDADALFALKGHTSILRKRKAATILTPHTGEFGTLQGMEASAADKYRVGAARDFARKTGAVIVLKGAPTVTAEPRGSVYVNSTGNPGMATIGSGDVLTGLVAGLAAQGMDGVHAAFVGVYLHGLAGDLASARYGERSMVATDILEMIPGAFAGVK